MKQDNLACSENPEYLQNQLITYIGNKRALLDFMGNGVGEVQKNLGKSKLTCLDVFAGSGIVSRYLKQFSSSVTVNDLENYSCIINRCYLSNQKEIDVEKLKELHASLVKKIDRKMSQLEGNFKNAGFISELYAPADEDSIEKGERCFYTPYNAAYLDVACQLIEKEVPENLREYFIAPLLSEASIHANTAGIFKGFYKNSKTGAGQFGGNGRNALSRIRGKIVLPFPVFSDFDCKSRVFSQDANSLVLEEELYADEYTSDGLFDLVYLDPPYNQHPYGSNYFMLNLILKNKLDVDISRVSGITQGWNRSEFNKRARVLEAMEKIVAALDSKYVIISYNSEGFINFDEMSKMLKKYGKLKTVEIKYNTFRGSRNLQNRDIHVKEYLFVLKKEN